MQTRHLLLVLIYALTLLMLVQSVGALVESIYILELLNTCLDIKAAAVLFLFAPALLFAFRRNFPDWLMWIAWLLLLVGRAAVPFLSTTSRLAASGLATAAALMLLPSLLRRYLRGRDPQTWLAPAQGLALALATSILLRTLNHSVDISMGSEAGWLGIVFPLALGLLIYLAGEDRAEASAALPEAEQPQHGEGPWPVILSAVGMMLVLTTVYFAFSSPAVIARWTGDAYSPIVGVVGFLALSWLSMAASRPGWFMRPRSAALLAWNLAFVGSLVGLILLHTVRFPASLVEGPVVGTDTVTYATQILGLALLILHPVLFVDFAVFAGGIARSSKKPAHLAAGFLLGSLLLLLLVFMQIFTNVWGYVPPVSSLFRNKFWLPLGLAGTLITLLAGWVSSREGRSVDQPIPAVSRWPEIIGIVLFIGILVAWQRETLPYWQARSQPRADADGRLTVMTYNIQQGTDVNGQRAYRDQLEVIRAINPDILALQESDTVRISTGNNDYVRYFAQELGYFIYYGPKTVAGTFGTAILSKLPIDEAYTFFSYSDVDEIGTAVVRVQFGGQDVWVINVHPDGSDAVMENFAEDMLAQADDRQNVIILGDFNLRPEEAAYQRIAAEYSNVWQAANPGQTLSRRIDHIFVSPDLAGSVVEANYIEPPWSATDHPTLWALIDWP